MFHIIMNITNVIMMFVLGAFFVWLSKKKKHNNETKSSLDTLQSTIDHQQFCIESMSIVNSSNADLLRVISDLIANKHITISGDNDDIARIFKEASYKLHSHTTGDDTNYTYVFLRHDCFNDTNNCIKVLSNILKNSGTSSVQDEVQDFIIQLR